MFGGLKVAATLVVIGAVVSEYIVANEGLGYLQLQASYKLDSPLLFAAVVMMAVLGLLAYELVVWLEKILIPWRKH
jgi:NitT/TauT family transport system permease protein